MDVWGLTGLMGSGKSFARELLAKKGIPCLDADVESSKLLNRIEDVRDLSLQEKELFLKQLDEAFPGTVDFSSSKVDKKKILQEVSVHEKSRIRLESIVIPRIGILLRVQVKRLQTQSHKVCFIEGTRLAESTLRKDVLKGIIFVDAHESVRFDRIKKRNPEHFESLIELQKSQDAFKMRKVSQEIWINNHGEVEFESQVNSFLKSRGYI